MRRSLARKTLTPYSFPSRAEFCKRECKVCTRPRAEPARRGKREKALFYRLFRRWQPIGEMERGGPVSARSPMPFMRRLGIGVKRFKTPPPSPADRIALVFQAARLRAWCEPQASTLRAAMRHAIGAWLRSCGASKPLGYNAA